MNNTYHKNLRAIIGTGIGLLLLAITIVSSFILNSCQKDEEIVISMGEPVVLSVSESAVSLSQKLAETTALSLQWTRGTNQGTGSSISYTLEIDKAGNEFSTAKIYEMGKGVFEKSFTNEILNDLVMNYWGITPGTSGDFEAKITANVTLDSVEDGVSGPIPFSVTPYEPVSEVLYMVGSASPNGWDIANATQLSAVPSQPWIFTYQGPLSVGSFKFAVSQEGCWCQNFYTKDPNDDEMMIFNKGGSGDDIQWQMIEGGNYKLTVDLLELKIAIEKLAGPVYTNLYIVGDASRSGWNIGSPDAFTQSNDDPFVFTYEAILMPGDFKISTFKGNWCDGDWINASQADQVLTATDYILTHGCDGPDNKWKVTEDAKGRYKITVNLYNNTIKIAKVMLYLIGDGGPNGWNIGNPEPMELKDGIYTFTGQLGASNPTGEIKISKFKGDWCNGDWINAATENQSISNTSYIVTHGCNGPDNKWKLKDGDAGNYVIKVDLDNEKLIITKQ